MQIFIRNDSQTDSLLVTAIRKEQKNGLEKFFPIEDNEKDPKLQRVVLRPGEDGNYTLTENYYVGMEIL